MNGIYERMREAIIKDGQELDKYESLRERIDLLKKELRQAENELEEFSYSGSFFGTKTNFQSFCDELLEEIKKEQENE